MSTSQRECEIIVLSKLFPKLEPNLENGWDNTSNRRRVDISQLYDELKKLRGTYVLCADICSLKPINETYGYTAGDLVIAETARRLDSAITDNMMMFRIGRDEFVVLTGYDSVADAEVLANKITALNGNPVRYKGAEIPLNIRIGITKIPNQDLSYNEVFNRMHDTIDKVKEKNAIIGTLDD